MARIKRRSSSNATKNGIPRKQLATMAARKSAPVVGVVKNFKSSEKLFWKEFRKESRKIQKDMVSSDRVRQACKEQPESEYQQLSENHDPMYKPDK